MTKLTGEELARANAEQLENRKELYGMLIPQMQGMTNFQTQWLCALVCKPEFRDFVLINGDFRETFDRPGSTPRPFTVLWYDTADQLHSVRLGQLKVLQRVDA